MTTRERNHFWDEFINIVQTEVKPALGCTEPVSVALACAVAAAQLTDKVDRIEAWVSPNLMKNGMGVTVPGTGMVGLPIAAALGALAGDATAGLEVLKNISPQAVLSAKKMLDAGRVKVRLQTPCDDILWVRQPLFTHLKMLRDNDYRQSGGNALITRSGIAHSRQTRPAHARIRCRAGTDQNGSEEIVCQQTAHLLLLKGRANV